MKSPKFIHTRVHTQYSIVDGLSTIEALVKEAIKKGMPAIAVTEKNNLFSALKFYTCAIQYGIKPIIGCDLSVEYDKEDRCAIGNVVFLCTNQRGYENLNQLVTKACVEGKRDGQALATYDWIEEHNEGLMVLSGGIGGDIGQCLKGKNAKHLQKSLDFWTRTFPDRYYLELASTGKQGENAYIDAVLQLAIQHKLPVVATNNVIFNNKDDFAGHEIKTCIQNKEYMDDPKRQKNYSEEQYLKTPQEMAQIFKDIPSALENSVEIAKRCNLQMEWGNIELPPFVSEEGQGEQEFLDLKINEGLQALYNARPDLDDAVYQKRIKYELSVIQKMGYEGYFLIVADFIAWAKSHQIPVGPGRGSGSGSLVAYLLGITEINPLDYDLLFERFLNPERVSMPDFDVDFCIEGRDQVIRYVERRYGKDRVSHINTFNALLAKAAIRDTGRVLGAPHNAVDRIAKMIPERIPSPTLNEAYKESKELKAECKADVTTRNIFDRAKTIEGLARNPGRHAAGIVIAPKPLTHYTALYQEEGTEGVVSHFDMKDIEKVGLVKFDFLGLKTLTIIHKAVSRLQDNGEDIDITKIKLDDAKTYKLLQKAETSALFQLESSGMRELIKSLRPDCFNDIVALVALFRPGPLGAGMSDQYAERKRGAPFDYDDPSLEPILKPTYGVILYQEQVMEIARELAGYSMGGADLLRRAMGKKIPEEMAQQRETFVDGAVGKGMKKNIATKIFNLIEYFAGYGFNKSHSVAYALLAYRTAWLKANYPAVFMATVMTGDSSDVEKLAFYINECKAMEIKVLPIDINRSDVPFRATSDGDIRFGFSGIRSISNYMVKDIAAERKENGVFESIEDFCMRMVSSVKKNATDILIRAGSFDTFGMNRGVLLQHIQGIVQMAEQEIANQNMGQSGLFGEEMPTQASKALAQPDSKDAFNQDEMLRVERQTLGFYLTAHPIDAYQSEVNSIASFSLRGLLDTSLEDMEKRYRKDSSLRVAGVIMNKQRKFIRRSQAILFSLDDGSGQIDLALFDKDYENCKDMLERDHLVFVEIYRVNYGSDQSNRRWRARKIYTLDQIRRQYAKSLLISLHVNGNEASQTVNQLKDSFLPYCDPRGCRVFIDMVTDQASTRLELGENWQVRPCQTLLDKLHHIDGIDATQINYLPS